MVSKPYRLHSSLILIRAGNLSIRVMVPQAPAVSYSTLWCAVPWYGPASFTDMWPPHDMVHRQQPYFLSWYAMTVSCWNRVDPLGKSTGPMPPQFLTGESPLMAESPVMPMVP